MHENREISCTSWSSDQDRSAKAINRTADVNVQEKSDCAVVPVNQPNKEGQPSAAAGEGRAQTEENIVQSHMHPTQSGKCMSQGMHGVRQAALPPTSLVRAVCVNALVRICAGGDQRWSSLPRQLSQHLHFSMRTFLHTSECRVSALVSVRFEIPCVLLHLATVGLMANASCLQDNAARCAQVRRRWIRLRVSRSTMSRSSSVAHRSRQTA
jgi:hypothetical protein